MESEKEKAITKCRKKEILPPKKKKKGNRKIEER